MSKLFETEKNKAKHEDFFQSDEREAEILLNPWIARKRSLLPKGNSAKYSKIKYLKNMFKHKMLCLFQNMMMTTKKKKLMTDEDEDGGDFFADISD